MPTAAVLRTLLRGRLPRDYVPARIVAASAIASGPDRDALRSPFVADAVAAAAASPQTDDERLLAEIWREVLGTVPVGRDDNFFALGGTSLLCFRVIERLRVRAGVRISPRAMLLGTLAQTAVALAEAKSSGIAMR